MSFFGKQYKKVRAENAAEFLGKLNLSARTLAMLKNPTSITTFEKNSDGSILYIVKDTEGKIIFDQKIVLDHDHHGYKAPDGMDTSVTFELEGDVLKSHMHLPNGKVVHMNRHFEANGFRLELYITGTNEKATLYYEVI